MSHCTPYVSVDTTPVVLLESFGYILLATDTAPFVSSFIALFFVQGIYVYGIFPIIEYGVVSTLTYGVQWDSALKWIKEKNPSIDLKNSTAYGNHLDTEIIAGEINKDAKVYGIEDTEGYVDVDYDEEENLEFAVYALEN